MDWDFSGFTKGLTDFGKGLASTVKDIGVGVGDFVGLDGQFGMGGGDKAFSLGNLGSAFMGSPDTTVAGMSKIYNSGREATPGLLGSIGGWAKDNSGLVKDALVPGLAAWGQYKLGSEANDMQYDLGMKQNALQQQSFDQQKYMDTENLKMTQANNAAQLAEIARANKKEDEAQAAFATLGDSSVVNGGQTAPYARV